MKTDAEYRDLLRERGVKGEYIDAFGGRDLDRIGNIVGVYRTSMHEQDSAAFDIRQETSRLAGEYRVRVGPYEPSRKYTLRHRILSWLFPDLAIELKVFEDAFHRCMKDNRKLEAKIAERADRADEVRIRRVDCAIARQLQASIERNSRMVTRLFKMKQKFVGDSEWESLIPMVEAISKDEEPTWPAA